MRVRVRVRERERVREAGQRKLREDKEVVGNRGDGGSAVIVLVPCCRMYKAAPSTGIYKLYGPFDLPHDRVV